MKTIICECGRVHWNTDNLREAHRFLLQPRTSRELADQFDISIQNANNRINGLLGLGLVEEVSVHNHPTGGIEKVWQAVVRTKG